METKNKKQFVKRDLTKEYSWTPSQFIDDEKPLTFIFKKLSNRELAELNDKLFSTKGNEIYTNQSIIDYDLVQLKVVRIENYLNDSNIYITLEHIPPSFYDSEIEYDLISELASYIRTVSIYGDSFF